MKKIFLILIISIPIFLSAQITGIVSDLRVGSFNDSLNGKADTSSYFAYTNVDNLFSTNQTITGTLFVTEGCSIANVLTVGAYGCNYTDIQSAITASTTGDVILIYPGTYTETLSFTGKTGIALIGVGNSDDVVIQNTNNTIININTATDIKLENLKILSTVTTTSAGMFSLTTGNVDLLNCEIDQNQTGSGINSPIVYIINSGTFTQTGGCICYTDSSTNAADKNVFKLTGSANLNLNYVKSAAVSFNGGTGVTAFARNSGTGIVNAKYCKDIVIESQAAASSGFIATAVSVNNIEYCDLTIDGNSSSVICYGINNTLGTTTSKFNSINVSGAIALNYSFNVASGSVYSINDAVIAANEETVTGGAVYHSVHAHEDSGDLEVTGTANSR